MQQVEINILIPSNYSSPLSRVNIRHVDMTNFAYCFSFINDRGLFTPLS